MNYYKISKSPLNNSTPDTVIYNNSQRYFILRNGDSSYHMSNIVISEDKKSLLCTLNTLPAEHMLHLTHGRGGHMRYETTKGQEVVLDEVHVYVQPDNSDVTSSSYNLNFDKINKIEVLEKDRDRTNTSKALGGAAITIVMAATAILVVGLIVAGSW